MTNQTAVYDKNTGQLAGYSQTDGSFVGANSNSGPTIPSNAGSINGYNPYTNSIPATTDTKGSSIPSLPNNSYQTPAPTSNISTGDITSNQNLQTTGTPNIVSNPNTFISSLNNVIANNAGKTTQSENTQQDLINRLAGAQTLEQGKGQAQSTLETGLGTDQYFKQIQDLNTSIAQMSGQYLQAEQNALQSGQTVSYGQGAYGIAQRNAAINLGTQAALLQAYQGNLTAAQNYAKHVIDLQYQPIESQIASLKDQILNNKDIMSSDQVKRAETLSAALTIQQEAVTQAREDKTNQFTLSQTAAQSGATTQQAMQIANAKSLGEALGIYSQIFNGESASSIIGQTNVDKANGVINGYNLGQGEKLGAYAADPQQPAKVSAIVATLPQNMTASSLQEYMDKIAPKAPITAQQIIDTANQYSVDPKVMAAVIQNDSQYGTQGAATHSNNPGNVGTTSPNDIRNYPTQQDGLNAVAQNLVERKISSQTQTQNTQANINQSSGSSLEQFNNVKRAAPPTVSGSIGYANATGDIYMPYTKDPIAVSYAKRNNISVLPPDISTQDITDLNTALSTLNQVQEQFTKVAPQGKNPVSNIVGKVYQGISNPLNVMYGSNAGNDIDTYNSSILPAAINSLKAITGNARLSAYTGSISTSVLPKVATGPISTWTSDTFKSGVDKIDAIRSQINSAIKSILPNSKGASPLPVKVRLSNGQTGTIDPKDFDTHTMSLI